ncbi:hypothetical protein DL93DRAFT_1754781 [Clavulina sp. PMI_390]|nr:hypothetical protein DL93DRAFT_1754781 [Clavulina sp. PMI_390]
MLPPEMIIHEEVTEEPIPANAPIVVVEPASASGGGADMPRIVNIASSAGGARTDSGYAGSLSPRIGLGPGAGIGQHSSTSSAPLLRNSVVSASVPASVSISEEGDVYVDAVEEHNHDGAAPDSQFPPTGITRPTPVRRNSQQQQHQQRFLYDVPISPYPASPRRQSASTTASSIRPASQRTTATAATGARRASASSASLPYRPQPHRELSRSTLYPRPVVENTSFAPHSRAGSGTASPARRSVSGRGMGIGTTAMGMRTGSPYRRGSGRYTIEHDDDDDSSAMSARSRSVVSDDDDVEEGQEVEFAVPLGAGSRLSLGLPPSSSSHHVRSRPRTPLPPTTATASISASGSVSAASSAVMPPPRLGMTSVVSIPDGGPEFWYGVLPEDDPDSPFRPVIVRPVGDDATGRSHDKHASRGGGETEGEKKKTKKAKLTKKKKKDVHEVDDDDNDVQNNNDDEVEPPAVNPIIAALSSRPNTRPSSPAPSVHSFRPGTPNSKRASRTAAPLPESAAARGYTHSHGASVSPFQPAYTTPYKKRDPDAEGDDDEDEEPEKVKSQFFDASIVRDPEKWRAAGLDQLEVEGPIGPHRGTRNRDEARERREKAREAREALRRDLLRREPEYVNEKADPAPLHATTAQEDLEMFAGAGAVREKSPAASIRTTSNHNVRRRPNAPPSSLGASDAQPTVVGKGYIPSHHGKSTSLRPGVHVIESEDYA